MATMNIPPSPYPNARYVPGEGPTPVNIMLIGEAPGEFEDLKGRPFVGRSGRLLRQIVEYTGTSRYYVTNVVKYRPPGNRTPTNAEIEPFLPLLTDEVERAQPAVIITLGATPLHVFASKVKITSVHGAPFRGTLGTWSGWVVPWFHPAYGLRNPKILAEMELDANRFTDEYARGDFTPRPNPTDYRRVTGKEMADYVCGAPCIAFDFEADAASHQWARTFSMMRGRPIGFSVSRCRGEARYTTDPITCIKHVLEDPTVIKVAHNLQYEYVMCAMQGIHLENGECTKTMAYVLRKPSTHLKDLSLACLQISQTHFEDVDWSDINNVVQYGCADSDMTLRLFDHLSEELRVEKLTPVYTEIERPLIPILAEMHMAGIPLDVAPLQKLDVELTAELAEVTAKLVDVYPYEVNWDSPHGISNVLYGPPRMRLKRVGERKGRSIHDANCTRRPRVPVDTCGCAPGIRFGASSKLAFIPPGLSLPLQYVPGNKAPSTSLAALRALARLPSVETPLLPLLEYRSSIQQALRNNVRRLPELVQEDGKIHPSFIQAGAFEETPAAGAEAPETGRLASRGPNVQNITHHGDTERPYIMEWAHQIRSAFCAPPGWTWVKADVSKEEPIIGYIVSGDEAWGRDLLGGGDVYKTAASFAYNIPVPTVDREQRQIGKRMAMAWLNRARSGGIRKSAFWLDPEAALGWCRNMDSNYPRFTQWHANELIPFAYEHGYVNTWFGRRCTLTKIWHGLHRDHQDTRMRVDIPWSSVDASDEQLEAERECVPLVIQGTAGDIIKLATKRVHRQLDPARAHIISLVHDEINLIVRADYVDQVCGSILSHMLDGLLPVQLTAEITTGPNWAAQKEWHP